ncbi:hypothetical protein CRE_09748 [Caenorhabditis remanei]|uniref:Uncharacterized protein n=1 Tax=Caenorhabditis remanei TaxID=31234 RepID=E3N4Z9_CAERE|nr:hypothetical protein CRE_09748 [Caenorhabditis remanei]
MKKNETDEQSNHGAGGPQKCAEFEWIRVRKAPESLHIDSTTTGKLEDCSTDINSSFRDSTTIDVIDSIPNIESIIWFSILRRFYRLGFRSPHHALHQAEILPTEIDSSHYATGSPPLLNVESYRQQLLQNLSQHSHPTANTISSSGDFTSSAVSAGKPIHNCRSNTTMPTTVANHDPFDETTGSYYGKFSTLDGEFSTLEGKFSAGENKDFKGHRKFNSSDRGLTIGKVMKSKITNNSQAWSKITFNDDIPDRNRIIKRFSVNSSPPWLTAIMTISD